MKLGQGGEDGVYMTIARGVHMARNPASGEGSRRSRCMSSCVLCAYVSICRVFLTWVDQFSTATVTRTISFPTR